MTQFNDDEPALLMVIYENGADDVIQLAEEKDSSDIKEIEENIWYLDNGANNHMTGRREKFEKLDRTVKGEVKFGEGSLVKIEGKCTIRIACKNGEIRELHGLYYILTLRSNIISLGQLSEDGKRFILNGEKLWVYDRCGKLLMQVTRSRNRLYKIHIKQAQQQCMLTRCKEEAWLWHQCLGHVNFKAMHKISKNGMTRGLPPII